MITEVSLKKDVTIFLGILVIVLGGILALYWYNQRTGIVADFSSQLFSWLLK